MEFLQKFLNGILEVAKFNPLAAVVILFLVLSGFVSWLAFSFFKDKKDRKKKQEKFIYASGLIANLEINLKTLVNEKVKELTMIMDSREDCYFVGEAGEPRRKRFYDIDNRIQSLEKDVDDLKQFLIFKKSN